MRHECVGLGSLYTHFKVYRSIEDGNFNVFKQDPLRFLTECFNAFLPENHISKLDEEFAKLIESHRIQWPACRYLSNITKYMIDMYRVNFENNIKVHARKRIERYFRICESNEDKRKKTIKFMFESYSKCEPAHELIEAIPDINKLEVDLKERGFFDKLLESNWFKSVYIFVAIQKYINGHQQKVCAQRKVCAEKKQKTKLVRNFTVVPLCSQQRCHIKIDHDVFHCLLKDLNLDPKRSGKKRGSKAQQNLVQFIKKASENWFKFFDQKQFKRMAKRHKTFDYQIDTDGVSASVLFKNKHRDRNSKPAEYINSITEKYQREEFDIVCGIDPGMKYPIAGVAREIETGEETNFKVSSRQFRASAGDAKRARIAKKLAGAFENKTRREMEAFPEIPSAMSHNWMQYIEHRLKHFEEAIKVYTDRR